MGLFGGSSGGGASSDNFGQAPSKNLTRDLTQTGKDSGFNPNRTGRGLGIDAVIAQGRKMGDMRRTQSNNSKVPNAKENSTKPSDPFFSYSRSTSGPSKEAIKDMGGKIRENSSLMAKFGLQSKEHIKKFGIGITGHKEYYQAGQARKDYNLIKEGGDVTKLSFYSHLSEQQKKTLRNDRAAAKGLGDILGGMVKK